jgi:hypothetical protein
MTASLSDAAAELAHKRWKDSTAEQRAAHGRMMRRALAVKEIVDQAPNLTPEQVAKIRAALSPEALAARAPLEGS